MPNRHRLHVPGGIYYLFRSTDPRHPIFSRPEEYARFDDLLPIALASADVRLLAYCWLPESLHLAVEIGEKPVADFMRALIWRYSRSFRQPVDGDRPWFRERYHATVVQAETYLESLVHYIHYLPVRVGLAAYPDAYPHSSHHAYLGRRCDPPVRTRRLLRLLGCRGADRAPYRCIMAEAPPESLSGLFERGMPDTPGVVGDAQFRSERSVPIVDRSNASARLINTLIAQIAERHALTIADMCSRSRRRELVLARAQIVWLAIRSNIGTLTDVARHLHHSPSAMTRAVARYRYSRPDLFRQAYAQPTRLEAHSRLRSATESNGGPELSYSFATQDR